MRYLGWLERGEIAHAVAAAGASEGKRPCARYAVQPICGCSNSTPRPWPGNICAATALTWPTGPAGVPIQTTDFAARRPPGGCDSLEDPCLDAREAQPLWASDSGAALQLITADAGVAFDLWSIRGPKRLGHDGRCLTGVVAPCAATGVRFRLADRLNHGEPFAFAVASGARLAERLRAAERFQLRAAGRTPKAPQPHKAAFDHMGRLIALDAMAIGVSRRDAAGLVFGRAAQDDWNTDPRHRSNLRYLLQRAEALRDGGYRALAGLPERPGDDDPNAENPTPPFSA